MLNNFLLIFRLKRCQVLELWTKRCLWLLRKISKLKPFFYMLTFLVRGTFWYCNSFNYLAQIWIFAKFSEFCNLVVLKLRGGGGKKLQGIYLTEKLYWNYLRKINMIKYFDEISYNVIKDKRCQYSILYQYYQTGYWAQSYLTKRIKFLYLIFFLNIYW